MPLKACYNYCQFLRQIYIYFTFVYMVIDYLKYLLQSSKSPSGLSKIESRLLNLIEKPIVLANETDILARLKSLKNQEGSIEVEDFGAGSKKINNSNRKIKTVSKYASIQPKYGQLYASILTEFKINVAIELGTSFGIGTSYLARAAKHVTTIEGCQSTAKIALQTFERLKITNIDLKVGEFSDILNSIKIEDSEPALIYIDGNHQEVPTLKYFEFFKSRLPENSILIFDDIYWSTGMKRAWQKIRQQPYFTIDLYQIGIVLLTKKEGPVMARKRY